MISFFQKIERCPKCQQWISKSHFYEKTLYLADESYLVEVQEQQSRTVACLQCLTLFLKQHPYEEVCFPQRTIITFKSTLPQLVSKLFSRCWQCLKWNKLKRGKFMTIFPKRKKTVRKEGLDADF